MDGSSIDSLAVREAGEADAAGWDAFVESHPEATFFHLFGWRRVVARSFGHATHFLMAERRGRVAGVLPLVHIRSRLFADALISNAFCVAGGPLASDPAARAALDARAVALAVDLGVDFLEYRCQPSGEAPWQAKTGLYVRFRKAIDPDPEANMRAIPRKQRAMVRKGIKSELAGVIDDDVDRLHRIYAVSVRNLGTPVFARRYFRNLKEEFGGRCDVVTVERQGTPVASVMNFYFRDEVLPYYGGATLEAREWAANDFMYWEVMRRACERGCRWFDFGRSKIGTGAYGFKKHWGFPAEPLTYGFHLPKGGEVPEINPLNPKYRMFIAVWQRLPLPVTRLIGPPIARNLG